MAGYDDKPTMSPEELIALAAQIRAALEEHIHPFLHGRHPSAQGAVLAELLSLWLAGHPPEVREELLAMHIEEVRKLTVVNAHILRGET